MQVELIQLALISKNEKEIQRLLQNFRVTPESEHRDD